jgi:hypothetical protein
VCSLLQVLLHFFMSSPVIPVAEIVVGRSDGASFDSNPFQSDPSPTLCRRLLELARLRKKAGRHVVCAKKLVLSPPLTSDVDDSTADHIEVYSSMLDQARLAKRKGHHCLSDDGNKLVRVLTASSSSCSSTQPSMSP